VVIDNYPEDQVEKLDDKECDLVRAFISRFPELGGKETCVVTVLRKRVYGSLPPDQYAFVELYCDDKGCDCRRVMISVYAHKARRTLATTWLKPLRAGGCGSNERSELLRFRGVKS
jgi:hypothetical protein